MHYTVGVDFANMPTPAPSRPGIQHMHDPCTTPPVAVSGVFLLLRTQLYPAPTENRIPYRLFLKTLLFTSK